MADIEGIRAHLRSRLFAESREEVNALEAVRRPGEKGLLPDRKDRAGLAVRRLLRGDLIDGAEQCPRRPYGCWRIQRSG